jgi:hypothetical protein
MEKCPPNRRATRQRPTLRQALFGKGPTEQDPTGHLAGGLLHSEGGWEKRSTATSLAAYPTLTLLVKSWWPISNTMGVSFTKGISLVSLAFKHRMQDRFVRTVLN